MRRLLLLVTSCLAATHPELRGEHPDPADIDSGQCVPIKCEAGTPPQECTRLCAFRHYLPVCQPPGDFCLCQRLSGGSLELISLDEVLDQPLDQEFLGLSIFAVIVPLGSFFQEDERKVNLFPEPPRRTLPEHHNWFDPSERSSSEDSDNLSEPEPFMSLSSEHDWNIPDTYEEVVVNVHEGRLYWLFRYVLTGLFLLMVALIMFEVIMCQLHSYEKLSSGSEKQSLDEPTTTKKKSRTLDIVYTV